MIMFTVLVALWAFLLGGFGAAVYCGRRAPRTKAVHVLPHSHQGRDIARAIAAYDRQRGR